MGVTPIGFLVKIKSPSRKHLLKSRNRALNYHWWLVQEKPKKFGRLGQGNKSNAKLRTATGPSEFIRMAVSIEDQRNGR